MKNLKGFFFTLIVCVTSLTSAMAQCPYDNTLYLYGDGPSQVGDVILAPECWGGDLLHLTNLKAGYTYKVSSCADPTFDSEITIYDEGGYNLIAYDDDGCGYYAGASELQFTPAYDGNYDILIDEYPCMNNYTDMDVTIELMSTGNGGGSTTVTIPVVVHVLWNTNEENISDAQINSQINVLNKDYRKQNADFSSVVPSVFQNSAADCNIEFCLAGITRTYTSVTLFEIDNTMKHTVTGGKDGWDPNHYLNIWVCNLGGGLLGYATFPFELAGDPTNDGIAILYTAFGNTGAVASPFDLGRTATHEVGHWLNLHHIWGDADCGDDLVNDTPTQQQANSGCPTYPSVTCNNGPNGDMFVNYMDYVTDACMAMFSEGQKARMTAALNLTRLSVISSSCNGVTAVDDVPAIDEPQIYPNPCSGTFHLSTKTGAPNPSLKVVDLLGNVISNVQIHESSPGELEINLPNGTPGIYFVMLEENNHEWKSRIVVQ